LLRISKGENSLESREWLVRKNAVGPGRGTKEKVINKGSKGG